MRIEKRKFIAASVSSYLGLPAFFLVLFLPKGGGEDGYQCDDFKTACQHQDGHDPLAGGGQEIVRTGDARYTRT